MVTNHSRPTNHRVAIPCIKLGVETPGAKHRWFLREVYPTERHDHGKVWDWRCTHCGRWYTDVIER